MANLRRKPENEPSQFDGNLDLFGLSDLIYALLQLIWGEGWGHFSLNKPKTGNPKEVIFPSISMSLKERNPGVVGNSGVRERKPRQRGPEYQVEVDGKKRQARNEGQMFDARIEFYVYGKSNKQAIETAELFMDFIHTYKGIFQKEGLQNIWFESDEEEDTRDSMASIYVRKLTYLVRFEKVWQIIPYIVNNIDVNTKELIPKLKKEGKLPSQEEK